MQLFATKESNYYSETGLPVSDNTDKGAPEFFCCIDDFTNIYIIRKNLHKSEQKSIS